MPVTSHSLPNFQNNFIEPFRSFMTWFFKSDRQEDRNFFKENRNLFTCRPSILWGRPRQGIFRLSWEPWWRSIQTQLSSDTSKTPEQNKIIWLKNILDRLIMNNDTGNCTCTWSLMDKTTQLFLISRNISIRRSIFRKDQQFLEHYTQNRNAYSSAIKKEEPLLCNKDGNHTYNFVILTNHKVWSDWKLPKNFSSLQNCWFETSKINIIELKKFFIYMYQDRSLILHYNVRRSEWFLLRFCLQ